MGLFSDDIQRTSVSLYIERLSNLDEVDWYLFQQLVESVQMQENGAREAVETIRKKLKHGDTQQKLHVLEILKLLMENSGQQFHRQLVANEKMPERFEIILTSPSENPTVKKTLLSLLGTWATKYKHESGMRSLADLYELGVNNGRRPRPRIDTERGDYNTPPPRSPRQQDYNSPRNDPPPRSPRQDYYSPHSARADYYAQRSPSPVRNERRRSVSSAAARPQHTETRPRSRSNVSRPSGGAFNFEKSKHKILEEIALANSNSNNLVNALKLINTSEDRWEIELQHDKRLQDFHNKCEESKRKIVRYARLVENEEWIGTLLATNEELLKALEMYDIMLAGEIPAMWYQDQQELLAYEPVRRRSIRAPPPPPPNRLESSPKRLEIEDSFSNMQIKKRQDEEDPFADPETPVEERREYLY